MLNDGGLAKLVDSREEEEADGSPMDSCLVSVAEVEGTPVKCCTMALKFEVSVFTIVVGTRRDGLTRFFFTLTAAAPRDKLDALPKMPPAKVHW